MTCAGRTRHATSCSGVRFRGRRRPLLRVWQPDHTRCPERLLQGLPAGVSTLQRRRLVNGALLTARLGPVLKYSSTDFARGGLIRAVRPYGSGKFGELGAEAGLSFDSRDTAAAATRGAHLAVEGHVYPSVWDVTSTFGEVHGEAATYLTAPISLRPTLALRVGGKRVWGSFPFQEAAYIGGHETVRGLYSYRFQGDASAFGNAELRLPVSKFNLLAPGELGVFGLADVGRVWLTGDRRTPGTRRSVGGSDGLLNRAIR